MIEPIIILYTLGWEEYIEGQIVVKTQNVSDGANTMTGHK